MKLTIALLSIVVLFQCNPSAEAESLQKKIEIAWDKFEYKVSKKITKFKEATRAFFNKIKEALNSGIAQIKTKLKNFIKLNVQAFFEKIIRKLIKGSDLIKNINKLADKKFFEWMDKIEDTFFTSSSQIKKFIEVQTELIKEKVHKNQSTEILTDFISKSQRQIQSCSNAALNPIKGLYNSTKEVVNRAFVSLEKIITDTLQCIKDISFKCGANLAAFATKSVVHIHGEVQKFQLRLVNVSISELKNFPCIIGTRLWVEVEKKKVQSLIEAIN